MGIPKFFRYIAQRWPLTSQLVNDNIIPEFDNMYLDMNSIIHMCTHANADNVGHLDEKQTFQGIANYIEHLFYVVNPKEVFFMAIDGVAPRAKMNQQRARRFRSAKDAEESRRKAIEQGIDLDEDPFDSNCITPGTVFMAHLTQFLKYFIAKKISEDSKWQNCKIILSGHEVPGEGEHKIMRFIRNLRSQPDYNPNTRHCLYGLDADLIMLGLSSHEPHFALLREEVTFGRKIQFQSEELSEKRFNLLHLSLAREYIQLELARGDYKTKPDFERQLDDVILILFFVGNDFLPELPMLMINDGAIPVIFDTYKEYLRDTENQYLSENGKINFLALKNWMGYLKIYQVRKFEEQAQVDQWYSNQVEATTSVSGVDDIILSEKQHEVFESIVKFMRKSLKKEDTGSEVTVTEEPKFVKLLAEQTGFSYEDGKLRLAESSSVPVKEALSVLRIYDAARVNRPELKKEYDEKFLEWKNKYYARKFGDSYDSERIQHASRRYLEGLQWVLFYYYRRCPSWSWFYDEHYAPMTTELISAIGDGFEPHFDENKPFKPFEQLMAVLPDRSAGLLPPALQHLVLEETSPIIDFYPHSFQLDRNGKKAEWESVVLIPFIDGERLLKYVRPIEENGLTAAEKARNSEGFEIEFYHNPTEVTFYQSPVPQMPSVDACTCVAKPLTFAEHHLKYGRLPGSRDGAQALAGFPTLSSLPFDWSLEKDRGVKIFEMPSRDYSVILAIKPASSRLKLGDRVYINWPFLKEAKITSIRAPDQTFVWTKLLPQVVNEYKKVGVEVGKVEAQVGVKEIQGLQRTADGAFVKDFDGPELFYPAQLIARHVQSEDARFVERKAVPVAEEFPLESSVLLLLAKFYGFPAVIKAHSHNKVDAEVVVPRYRDPVFSISQAVAHTDQQRTRWFSLEEVAKSLELPVKFLMSLTARLMVDTEGKSVNVALQLRKHGLGLKADGFSRIGYYRKWEFSERGVALLVAYLSRFRAPLLSLLKGGSKVDPKVVKEMRAWLDKHTSSLVYIPVTTKQLNPASVKVLEDKLSSLPPFHLEKALIKGIDRGALLTSSDAHHQLRTQSFKLGDRVVSALDYGKVPLYSRGVVIGINGESSSTTLDVLWDYEFSSASTLDGRLSTRRGLTVPASSVLNLSKAQMEYTHGKAPTVVRISAKVDTRQTPAAKASGSSLLTNNKVSSAAPVKGRYVPAPPRNDWNLKKQQHPHQQLAQMHLQAGVPPVAPAPAPAPAPAAAPAKPVASEVNPAVPAPVKSSPTGNSSSPKDTQRGSKNRRSDSTHTEPQHSERPKNRSSKSDAQRTRKHNGKGVKNNKNSDTNEQSKKEERKPEAGFKLPEVAAPKTHDPDATKKLLSTLFGK